MLGPSQSSPPAVVGVVPIALLHMDQELGETDLIDIESVGMKDQVWITLYKASLIIHFIYA